jgi:hypothetical protein
MNLQIRRATILAMTRTCYHCQRKPKSDGDELYCAKCRRWHEIALYCFKTNRHVRMIIRADPAKG